MKDILETKEKSLNGKAKQIQNLENLIKYKDLDNYKILKKIKSFNDNFLDIQRFVRLDKAKIYDNTEKDKSKFVEQIERGYKKLYKLKYDTYDNDLLKIGFFEFIHLQTKKYPRKEFKLIIKYKGKTVLETTNTDGDSFLKLFVTYSTVVFLKVDDVVFDRWIHDFLLMNHEIEKQMEAENNKMATTIEQLQTDLKKLGEIEKEKKRKPMYEPITKW